MLAGRILAGGLLLVLGRRLFWFYVAVLGFAAGLTLASRVFHVQPEWMQLVIGIMFGIVGAILAFFFQEIAIVVAGFLAGASIALTLMAGLTGNPNAGGEVVTWVAFILGGVAGAALAAMLFDWALIILSSLAGALLITEGLQQTGPIGWLIAGGLFILGIIIQVNLERPPQPEHKSSTA